MAIGVFSITLPWLRPVFPSVTLANILHHANCANPVAASAGYEEPSLVFLAGTDTRLTDASSAADFLLQGSCRFAFIEARQERTFALRAEAIGLRYERGTDCSGLQHSQRQTDRYLRFSIDGQPVNAPALLRNVRDCFAQWGRELFRAPQVRVVRWGASAYIAACAHAHCRRGVDVFARCRCERLGASFTAVVCRFVRADYRLRSVRLVFVSVRLCVAVLGGRNIASLVAENPGGARSIDGAVRVSVPGDRRTGPVCCYRQAHDRSRAPLCWAT